MNEFREIYEDIIKYNEKSELMKTFYDLPESKKQNLFVKASRKADDEISFVKCFFDKLKNAKLTEVDGSDAQNMYQIWENSQKYYPLFNDLTKQEQVNILQKCYVKGFKLDSLAKYTYDVFVDEGLDKIIRRFDINLGKYKILYKVKTNPVYRKESGIKPSDYIDSINFFYMNATKQIKFRTTLSVSDMWDLLKLKRNPLSKRKYIN